MQPESRFSWLKDSRVVIAIFLAVAVGFGVGLLISGQLWHLPPNYGDVPTWLAAFFALIAGLIGLSQLGTLRKQIKEEADRNKKRDKLLDRQLDEAEARSIAAERGQADGVKVRLTWDQGCRLYVLNDSSRPITDVTCQLVEKNTKNVVRAPERSGIALRLREGLLDPPLYGPPDPRVNVLAPEERAVFYFGSVNRNDGEIFAAWFTDDAGRRGQLNEVQHLVTTHGDEYRP